MKLPSEVPSRSGVLVAGCGGGFDIVCALPIILALRAAGHRVHLANYRFVDLHQVGNARRPLQQLYRVDAGSTPPPGGYFPEWHLARWWQEEFGEECPVWCFSWFGVRPIAEAYAYLQKEQGFDTVFVVDAGVDGLFLGNEFDLAIPAMDAVSILAASTLNTCYRYFAFTALGTEGRAHSVRHADALLRVSELTGRGAMRGVSAPVPNSADGRRFMRIVRAIHAGMDPDWQSIMAASLLACLEGKFGCQAVLPKTEDAPLWISPLTGIYWFFDLCAVAEARPYGKDAMATMHHDEVDELIRKTGARMGVMPRADIPI